MGHQLAALLLHPADQLFFKDCRDNGVCGGTGCRVAKIGMAMLKEAAPSFNGTIDIGAAEHRANRLVSRTKPLCDCHDIRPDGIRLAGKQMARPAHAAHHLIQNEENAMAVTYFTNPREIALNRGNGAKRRADDRLGNKGHHRVRAKPLDFGLQFISDAGGKRRLIFPIPHFAIGIAGRNMAGLDKQRVEGLPPPRIATGSKRTERIAMITLAAGNDMPAFRPSGLNKILARQLQCRFDCLGTARDKIDVANPRRGMFDKKRCQRLGRLRGKKAGMREGKISNLRSHRLNHGRMAVPETGHRRAPGPVKIAFAIGIDDVTSLSGDSDRIVSFHAPRKHM